MQDEFAALKPRLHFPGVIRVITLRNLHRFTGIILRHRRCLLGTAGKTKPEGLALGSALNLQPYVHTEIVPPWSTA
jgi:hypothetical protein